MTMFGKSVLVASVLAGVFVTTAASGQTLYMRNDRDTVKGTEAMLAGDLEVAAKYLKRASKKNLGTERLVPVLNNLCAVNYALGNLEEAEQACSRAIGEDRHFWRAYVNRGNVRLAAGDKTAAQSDYSRAVALNPQSDLPNRALARLMEGQTTQVAEARP